MYLYVKIQNKNMIANETDQKKVSQLIDRCISYYFPKGVNNCILPIDLLRLCISYNVELKRQVINDRIRDETSYVNGQLHGECKVWYEDSKIRHEHHYVNGQLHGECKSWYRQYEILSIRTYVDGKLRCKKGSYEDGRHLHDVFPM